jgi:hypothetical protein
MIKMKTRKGQEEVMGFVLIVMIVIIIGIVFFAFSMRKTGQSVWQQSSEASDFLNSILAYTTPYKIGGIGTNQSVKELLQACAERQRCGTGTKDCCTAANSTISDIFGHLQADASGKFIHGYNLTATDGATRLVTVVTGETTTGSSFISSVPIPVGKYPNNRDIEVKLRSWYSKNATG